MFKLLHKIKYKYYKWRTKDDLKAAYLVDEWTLKNTRKIDYIKNNKGTLLLILILGVVIPLGIYLFSLFTSEKWFPNNILNHSSGNLLAELYGGYIFLIVAILIQKGNDKKLSDLHKELEQIELGRKYQRMIDFINTGDQYDVALKKYKDKEDVSLTYNISPARDKNNIPIYDHNGLGKTYVVKINGISFKEVLSKDRLTDYLKSPVSAGEYYFVNFRNKQWGFQTEDDKFVPFYWSGKNGHCRSVPSANKLAAPKLELEVISSFIYDKSRGKESNSGYLASILKDNSGKLFIKPTRDSNPKNIFITFPENDFQKEKPFIKIENIYGFFDSTDALEDFKSIIQTKLKEKEVELPEREWWIGKEIYGL